MPFVLKFLVKTEQHTVTWEETTSVASCTLTFLASDCAASMTAANTWLVRGILFTFLEDSLNLSARKIRTHNVRLYMNIYELALYSQYHVTNWALNMYEGSD